MTEDGTLLQLAREILLEIRLLSAPIKAKAEDLFEKDFLTSDTRKAMWANLEHTAAADVAVLAGCKERNVQAFMAELVEAGLVKTIQDKPRLLEKDSARIAAHYLRKGSL